MMLMAISTDAPSRMAQYSRISLLPSAAFQLRFSMK